MSRVVAYVDGFNLFYGLREANLKRCYWLDLHLLARNMLKPDQQLVHAHYFTARLSQDHRNAETIRRQNLYLDALATRADLTIHEGQHLRKSASCRSCGASWATFEEKMTDVNIAMALLCDAFDDRFDTAMIISGDSDLTTPVRRVRERFPTKRVIVAFPPARSSKSLKNVATGHFNIGEDKLRKSLLPDIVTTTTGVDLHRPPTWR